MASLRGPLLGIFFISGISGISAAAAPPSRPVEAVYVIRQQVSVDGSEMPALRKRMLSGVTLEPGRSLRTRLLWSAPIGSGAGQSALALDPDNPDAQALLEVMAAGIDMRLDDQGGVTEVRSVAPQAWQTLTARQPYLAQVLTSSEQSLGLRPRRLPASLAVGQHIVQHDATQGLGAIVWRMQVRAVTADAVVLDTTVEGDTLRGTGRQALRRADGMPLEARFEFHVAAGKSGTPASTHRLHLADLAEIATLDVLSDEDGPSVHDATDEALRHPPFSAPSHDPADYVVDTQVDGELEPWMLDAAALPDIESSLLFGLRRDARASRPLLRLEGEMRSARDIAGNDDTAPPRVVSVRLRGVELLDRTGQALPRLRAVPVPHTWMLMENYQIGENDLEFPLRLPLDTRAAELDALDTLRATVDVEAYQWDGSEALAQGQPSQRNAHARIVWTSAQRATLLQDLPPPAQTRGVWTTAVPVDAAGRPIAAATQIVGRAAGTGTVKGSERPLSWELDRLPLRLEIATAQPIAALKLRHYRWETVSRQWVFQNASTLTGAAPH